MNSKVMTFIEENMKTIFAYSLSRCVNKEDAEDLSSEIILAILNSADKIRNEDAFFGYVWSIAANTYKKFLRKKSKYKFSELDEDIADNKDISEDIMTQEEMNILRRELSILSKEYRECTVAYYFEGLSCKETSEKLGISLDMVKYYLFKTRKILKEGISMEREFGEKSYNPAKFEFSAIFSGQFNREYNNLFTRKLPGQIMLSAYYTPITIRELAIELGVASVYLEDEIGLLEKYDLIKGLQGGKYQTNILVFTDDFTKEFNRESDKVVISLVKDLIVNLKKKLDEVRKINFLGNKLPDEQLIWGLLFPIMGKAKGILEDKFPRLSRKKGVV